MAITSSFTFIIAWKKSFTGEVWKKKKKWGGTRIWTGDLSICSRMLYHWAIPPRCVTKAKLALYNGARVCRVLSGAWRRQPYLHQVHISFRISWVWSAVQSIPPKGVAKMARCHYEYCQKAMNICHVQVYVLGTVKPCIHLHISFCSSQADTYLKKLRYSLSKCTAWRHFWKETHSCIPTRWGIILDESLSLCSPPSLSIPPSSPHHQSFFPHQPPPAAASLHETRGHANRQPRPSPAVHAQQVQR